MTTNTFKSAIVALALAFATTSSHAQETTLKWPVENVRSGIYTNFYKPWSERINAQGAGVLTIEVMPGGAIANISNMYDRVTNDVVQMGFTLFANVSGKFVLSDVASLPFVAEDAEQASIALYRLYKSGMLDAEFTDVHPLLLVGLPQSLLHMTKPLKSLEPNWAGAKIITPTKIVSLTTQQLGGSAMTLQVTDMYSALQRGTADGVIVSWNAFAPFKLDEVTSYSVDTTLGTAAGFVIMAKKTYAGLPAAAKKVIDANSGEAATREYAKVWDADNDRVRQQAKALPNHTTVTLNAAQTESWRKKVQGALDEWVKGSPNGAKVLAEYRRLLVDAKK